MFSYSKVALLTSLLSLPLNLIVAAPLPDDPTTSTIVANVIAALNAENPWTIKVTLGVSSFLIGDITDGTIFSSLLKIPCSSTGCVPDDPQTFTSNVVTSAGSDSKRLTGKFEMTGDYNDWTPEIRGAMLDHISTALAKTVQCTEKKYTHCSLGKRTPENGHAAQDCAITSMMQCTAVDYISAVAYGPAPNGEKGEGASEGWIHMVGSSEEPQGFDCRTVIDIVSAGLGPFEIAGFGAASGIATAVCDLLG